MPTVNLGLSGEHRTRYGEGLVDFVERRNHVIGVEML